MYTKASEYKVYISIFKFRQILEFGSYSNIYPSRPLSPRTYNSEQEF